MRSVAAGCCCPQWSWRPRRPEIPPYRRGIDQRRHARAPEARSGIDWTLSRIALSDRILAAAARDVLTGLSPVVDNREAMDNAAITALIASTTRIQRVDLVRRNAGDLSAALKTIPITPLPHRCCFAYSAATANPFLTSGSSGVT